MTRVGGPAGRRQAGIAAVVLAFALSIGTIAPHSLSLATLEAILVATPLILIAAMGQTAVIIGRHIDLSVGSILGFSAIVVGMMFREVPGLPLWIGFVVAVGVGAALGLVNGVLVAHFRLPAIIVTLGTMSIFRGLIFIVSGGRQVDPDVIPPGLIALAQTSSVFPVAPIVLIALATVLATHAMLAHSRVGREIFALGSNPEAMRLRGVNVAAITVAIFMFSGAAAGLAAILYAARFGYVNPGITGVSFELVVISAVVVGGTSISGGQGSALGTTVGVLLLGAISVLLPAVGVSGFWQNAIYGAIIIIALVVDRTIRSGGVRAAVSGPVP